MVELNSNVAAYTAGIIDGEGCISVRKDRGLLIQVANTDLDLLVWIRDHWGGRLYAVGYVRKPRPRCKPLFLWNMYGKDAIWILEILLPFLIVKKAQALVALKLKNVMGKFDPYHRERNVPWRALRDQVYEELKLLKKGQAELPPKKQKESRQSVLEFTGEHIA